MTIIETKYNKNKQKSNNCLTFLRQLGNWQGQNRLVNSRLKIC